jgi:hypothetical protein
VDDDFHGAEAADKDGLGRLRRPSRAALIQDGEERSELTSTLGGLMKRRNVARNVCHTLLHLLEAEGVGKWAAFGLRSTPPPDSLRPGSTVPQPIGTLGNSTQL